MAFPQARSFARGHGKNVGESRSRRARNQKPPHRHGARESFTAFLHFITRRTELTPRAYDS